MAINESVQYALAQTNWKARTLVEVANAGQLFLITEAEFDRILEAEQLDEGVKEWIAKAREFAKKLPANIQQAQQAVVKATGKALDASNSAYVKAQQMINKIPLIGRIPEQTRNRLMLGLALSFAAGMGTDASAADSGGGDVHGHAGAAADHATAGHGVAGHTGDPTGGGEGTTPAPEPAPVTTGSGTEADPHTTVTQKEGPGAEVMPNREGRTSLLHPGQVTDKNGRWVNIDPEHQPKNNGAGVMSARPAGGGQPAGGGNAQATEAQPDAGASAIVHGPQGNQAVQVIGKNETGGVASSAFRDEVFKVADRAATGDVTGAKAAYAAFLEKHPNMDEAGKKAFMDLLKTVVQTAKANGVKLK
jgi:hypothetical protein